MTPRYDRFSRWSRYKRASCAERRRMRRERWAIEMAEIELLMRGEVSRLFGGDGATGEVMFDAVYCGPIRRVVFGRFMDRQDYVAYYRTVYDINRMPS